MKIRKDKNFLIFFAKNIAKGLKNMYNSNGFVYYEKEYCNYMFR